MQRRFMLTAVLGALLLAGATTAEAQHLPGDDNVRPWGQGVAPIFEGWYPNPDGDGYYISFGYLNRNSEEIVDVPRGQQNFLSPERFTGRQPTHFETRRHYGWFTVLVPEDFGRNEVTWSMDFRGEQYEIPGHVHNSNYGIDAMYAPGTGLTPPLVRLEEGGEEIQGPHGNQEEVTRTVGVGEPLELTVFTEDDSWYGAPNPETGQELEPHTVTLRFYHFSGPGDVTFDQDQIQVEGQDELAEASNTATFSEPGEYTIMVRANNEGLRGAGMEQCCWTNAYVDVTVEE